MAANADRYPVSAQCEILGVPRSTYYHLRSHPETPPAPRVNIDVETDDE